jgi:hypothetical protein
MSAMSIDETLLDARARILHDLQSCACADASTVSIVEDAVTHRRWWVEEWPDGAAYVAGQIAQDVQDALLDKVGRWPLCRDCDDESEPHELRIEPEVGENPRWVCEIAGIVIAPLGAL